MFLRDNEQKIFLLAYHLRHAVWQLIMVWMVELNRRPIFGDGVVFFILQRWASSGRVPGGWVCRLRAPSLHARCLEHTVALVGLVGQWVEGSESIGDGGDWGEFCIASPKFVLAPSQVAGLSGDIMQ